MNIFVSSECPVECAKFLDTKRVIKMVVETGQILSTAIVYSKNPEYFIDNSPKNKSLRSMSAVNLGIYKPTHVNHPCSVWVRQTKGNFDWLYAHFEALIAEYTLRTGNSHKTAQIKDLIAQNRHHLPDGPLKPFVNCAANDSKGISYKNVSNVFLAYKLYLNDRWDTDAKPPKWD